MKEIRAYIQPHKLNQLTLALMEIPDFPGMSVMDCEGFGRERTEHIQDYKPFLAKNGSRSLHRSIWWRRFFRPS